MNDTLAALQVVNQMLAAGVIGKYAIGGAVAATFYIDPAATWDIDIFIPFENVPGTSLVSLGPIFSHLIPLGYKPDGAHIIIAGWPVQFLPAEDNLYREALMQATQTQVGNVQTWVMTAEHLMAIALRTGRGKDLIRLGQFIEYRAYNVGVFNEILARHQLLEKWRAYENKFGEGNP